MTSRARFKFLLLAFGVVFSARGHAQESQEVNPAAALASALSAACRQSEVQFARYQTAENAAALPALVTKTSPG